MYYKGRVIKGLGSMFTVLHKDKTYLCSARGRIKTESKILIGDYVEFSKLDEKTFVIENILTRKNEMIRPEVANIDCVVVLIAPEPVPDLLLVDKLLLYAFKNDIEVLLIVNKIDIASSSFIDMIAKQYKNVARTVFVSAKCQTNTDGVIEMLANKFVVLSGQSAVGKTALLNALDSNLNLKEGELSKKLSRGKHTTRHTEFFKIGKDIHIADTPGFSLMNIDLEHDEIGDLYPEFREYSRQCKFRKCTHINQKHCEVIRRLELNQINQERYNRYIKIYNQLKERWDQKYD